jgi:restriction system protein
MALFGGAAYVEEVFVKFKMAPNSGFAVLLRSPWWVSFLLAGAIALACGALLPRDVAPFAAIGVLPLTVVGCIAAWRQWHAPSAAAVQAAMERAAGMPWREFAELLERSWKAEGYAVARAPGQATAYDFALTRDGKVSIVSARRWKAALHGIEPLRELVAEQEKAAAATAVYLALQPLGENAQLYARDQNIAVLQGQDICALMQKA